jgi:hypothetical protein
MKALRMYAPYDFRIDDVPIPEIGPEEILIKVEGCGICAGDIKTFQSFDSVSAYDYALQRGNTFQRLLTSMEKPVIAAVAGMCLAGGLELALMCDFIYATENAAFGLLEINLGLLAGWGGTTRLPRVIPAARAREMIYRGEVIQAPIWSFQTHRREGYREVSPGSIVACEGIHALHEPVRGLFHLKIFVEASREVRWSRWEHLEATGQRGWGVEKAREFFEQVAEPTFATTAQVYRECADIVVVNG